MLNCGLKTGRAFLGWIILNGVYMFQQRKWDIDKTVATLRKVYGFSFLSYIYRFISHFRARKLIKNNRHLKDIHYGDSCFILGNGISLSEIAVSELNKKVIFACNEIFHHPNLSELNISYFTISEPYYGFLCSRNYKQQTRNLYQSVDLSFKSTETKFIFHTSLKRYFAKKNFLKGRDIIYFCGSKTIYDEDARYDLSREFSFGAGALPTMIGAALFMGFKEIHLVGCGYTFSPIQLYHFWSRPSVGSTQFDREEAERYFMNFADTDVDSAYRTELSGIQEADGLWLPIFTQEFRMNPIYETLRVAVERAGAKIFNVLPRHGEYTSPVFTASELE